MAGTRFYLPGSGTPSVTPASVAAAWERGSGAVLILPMSPDHSGVAGTSIVSVNSSGAANTDVVILQFVSDALSAQTIPTGTTFRAQLRALESIGTLAARTQLIVRTSTANGVIRATVVTENNAGITQEFSATGLTNRSFLQGGAAAAIADVTVFEGDRLVVEMGWRVHSTVVGTATFRLRDQAGISDLPVNDNTSTSDFNSWFEFVSYNPIFFRTGSFSLDAVIVNALRDTFTRTVGAGSWGTPDVGPTWGQSSADYSTDGSTGLMVLPSSATTSHIQTSALSLADATLLFSATLPALPVGTGVNVYGELRRVVATGDQYQVVVIVQANGVPVVILQKVVATVVTSLVVVGVSGQTVTAGAKFWVEFSLIGSSLQATMWLDGTPKPAAQAQVSDTDILARNTAALQIATTTALTNFPFTVKFDDVRIDRLARPTSSFTLAAILRRSVPASFTLDAIIRVPDSPMAPQDAFGRTVASGWGNADRGGPWSTLGGAFAVGGGAGTQVLSGASGTAIAAADLPGAPLQDIDVRYRFKSDKLPANSGEIRAHLYVRYTDSSHLVVCSVNYQAAAMGVVVTRYNGGGGLFVIAPTTVPLTPAINTWYWVRLQAVGAQYRVKVWLDGSNEPVDWQFSGTNVDVIQVGGISLRAESNNSADRPVTVSFDDLSSSVRFLFLDAALRRTQSSSFSLDAVIVPPGAQDSFSRTVASGFGNADVGGAYSTSGTTSVGGGVGILNGTSSGGSTASLIGVHLAETDVVTRFLTDKLPLTGQVQAGLSFRYSSTSNRYRTTIYINPTTMTWEIGRVVANSETILGNGVLPITPVANTWYWIRVRNDKRGYTQIRMWPDGTPEPTTWNAQPADITTSLVGGPSMRMVVTDAAIGTVQLMWDDLVALPSTPLDSFTLDAALRRNQTGSFTLNAIRRTTVAGSFALNAVLKRTQTPEQTLILDTFSGASFGVADTGQNWSDTAGFSLSSGRALSTNPNKTVINAGFTDVVVDADVDVGPSSNPVVGVLLRSNAAKTSYLLIEYDLSATDIPGIRCYQDGSATVIAAASVSFGPFHLRVVLAGTVVQVFADGILKLTLSDSHSGTYFGLGQGSAFSGDGKWDNFRVSRSITGGTLDAVLKRAQASSFSLDAQIARTQSSFFRGDAIFLKTQVNLRQVFNSAGDLHMVSLPIAHDAIIRKPQADSFTANAVQLRTYASSFTLDANRRTTSAGSFTLDAYRRITVSASRTLDATLRRTQSSTFQLEAFIRGAGVSAVGLDAVLKRAMAGSFTLDAIRRQPGSGSFSLDAWRGQTPTISFGLDAIVLASHSKDRTLDAVLQRTKTSTSTLDAVLWRTQAGSFSLNAVFRVGRSGSFALDAYRQTSSTGSFTAAATVRWTQVGAIQLNALLRQTGSASFVLDAVRQRTQVGSFTLDAYLLAARSGSFVLAAVLSRAQGGSFSLDAYLLATRSGSFTADAVLYREQASSFALQGFVHSEGINAFALDAVIEQIQVSGFALDALLRRGRAGSFTLDAYLQGAATYTFSLAAVLSQEQLGSFAIRATLRHTQSGSCVVDAVISVTRTASAGLDAVIQGPRTGSFSLDAIHNRTGFGSCVVDAVLRRSQSANFALDATIAGVAATEGSFTLRAVVKAQIAGSFSLDAVRRLPGISSSFTLDAYRRLPHVAAFTLDAVLKKPIQTVGFVLDAIVYRPDELVGSFSLDAVRRRTQPGSYTLDAWRRLLVSSTFTLNATRRAVIAPTFSLDAVLKRDQSSSFNLNATIPALRVGSFPHAAVLRAVAGATLPLDAVVRAPASASTHLDAYIKRPRTGSFALDATLSSARTVGSTLDAVLLSPETGTFALDAVRRATRSGSFSLDAFRSDIVPGSFVLEARLVATQATTIPLDAVLFRADQLFGFALDAIVTIERPEFLAADLAADVLSCAIDVPVGLGCALDAQALGSTIDQPYWGQTLTAEVLDSSMGITFIQGDTAPDLTATIHKADDVLVPADLTGATVNFRMRKPDDRRYTVNQPADIVDALAGKVSYTWAANDLAVPGTYEVTWHITFPDAKEQTTLKQTIEVQRE